MYQIELTVSLGSIFETEGEGELRVVLEELCGEGVPPQVVALLRPLLQPLVHLVDPVVRLRDGHRTSRRPETGSGRSKSRLGFEPMA